ncbi:hypothetical protein D3C78_528100 [compost metagenome]
MAACMRTGSRGPAGQQGFTYFGVLFIVVVMGLMLASIGEIWATAAKREKERQLLWVGTQYASALRSYYASSPGLAQFPSSLEELLEDKRFPQPQHHLRRLYPDPMTGDMEWGLVRTIDGRISGVYSQSRETPIKTSGFPLRWEAFEGMESYSDWQFVAEKDLTDSRQSGGGQGQPGSSGRGQPFVPSPLQSSPLPSSPAGSAGEE